MLKSENTKYLIIIVSVKTEVSDNESEFDAQLKMGLIYEDFS